MLITRWAPRWTALSPTARVRSPGRFPTRTCFVSTSRDTRAWGLSVGRRLYETMLGWETDPSMRDSELDAAFADAWCAIPKIVFSRTIDSVQGNARLAEASLGEEAAAAARRDRQGRRDRRRRPGRGGDRARPRRRAAHVPLSGRRRWGTPFLPPVTEDVPLDLIETRTFGSRVIYERYGRARDESD